MLLDGLILLIKSEEVFPFLSVLISKKLNKGVKLSALNMHHLNMRHALSLLVVLLVTMLTACSGTSSSSGNTPTTTVTVAKLIVTSSTPSVKSDNSDVATITVTALDANNVVVKDAPISFKTASGALIVVSATTDASGKATATYGAGDDRSNRVEVVTVSSGGAIATAQVRVVGTALTLQPLSGSNVNVDSSVTLQYKLTDSGASPIVGQAIQLSFAGVGSVSFSSDSIKTDVNGMASVVVAAKSAGDVSIRAESMGATLSQVLTIANSGSAFSAVASKTSASLGEPVTINVSAPGASAVVFASTFGVWNGGTSSVYEAPVVDGAASAVFASSVAGIARISVYDKAAVARKSTLNVAYSAPSSAAVNVVLQGSPTSIAPSVGGVQNTSTITATVTDATGARVANAPVSFRIVKQTSGGESFSDVVAFTSDGLDGKQLGVATTTFISGSLPSGQTSSSVQVIASVNGYDSAPLNLTIAGGISGSVTIGQSSTIYSVSNDTVYRLPMSVQVADAAGNPVRSATVTLSVWPIYWSTGRFCSIDKTYSNEDANEDLVLGSSEDGVRISRERDTFAVLGTIPGGTKDGIATPPNSAAGSIPKTVTTDENGVATFDYLYLKSNSIWTVVRMTASTVVQGSETKSQVIFRLAASEADAKGETCRISDSPYQF